jgi:hypothetical protein
LSYKKPARPDPPVRAILRPWRGHRFQYASVADKSVSGSLS